MLCNSRFCDPRSELFARILLILNIWSWYPMWALKNLRIPELNLSLQSMTITGYQREIKLVRGDGDQCLIPRYTRHKFRLFEKYSWYSLLMYNNYLDAFFGKIFILFSIFSILPTAVSKNKTLNCRIKSKYDAYIEILPCF